MAELILALDVTEKKQALAIAHACASSIDAIKIGYPLVLSCGLAVAGEFESLDLPLIADFKVADIPNTNRLIAGQVFDAGFSSIICHGFTGKDAVQTCVDVSRGLRWRVFCRGGDEPSRGTLVLPWRNRREDREPRHGMRGRRDHRPRHPAGAGEGAPENCREAEDPFPGHWCSGGDAAAVAKLVDGIIVGRAIYEAEDPAAVAETFAKARTG